MGENNWEINEAAPGRNLLQKKPRPGSPSPACLPTPFLGQVAGGSVPQADLGTTLPLGTIASRYQESGVGHVGPLMGVGH